MDGASLAPLESHTILQFLVYKMHIYIYMYSNVYIYTHMNIANEECRISSTHSITSHGTRRSSVDMAPD